MGQKCSCFEKDADRKLEKNMYDYPNKKDNYINDNKNQNARVSNQYAFENSTLTHDGMGLMDYSKNGKYYNGKQKTEKLEIIIRNIASWYFKKKFIDIQKKPLQEISDNLYKEYMSSEKIIRLKDTNNKIKNKFDLNGWKLYYNDFPLTFNDLPIRGNEENFIDYNQDLNQIIKNNKFEDLFGNTQYKNSILIIPEKNQYEIKFKNKSNFDNFDLNKEKISSYIYEGHVNKLGQKHGQGVLYYINGSSMEIGTWYNNYLIGWSRKILPSGIYIDCNIKFII